MTRILSWLDANKQWVFSGVGVAVLVAAWQILKRVAVWRRLGTTDHELWIGVESRARYYAWDGPALHSLEMFPPVPAPDHAIAAIRAAGGTPLFGLQARLRDHLADGAVQVFETDRQKWKRELLHPGQGDQVLLVKVLGAPGAA